MLQSAKNFFIDGQLSKQKQIPILVMFSAPDCSYCKLVKKEVLNPMNELKEYKDKVIIRHIFYSSLDSLIDFNNKETNQSKFNFVYSVNFYPTIILLNSQGDILAKKVGVTLIDTYWTELDQMIEESIAKIKQQAKAIL